MFCVVDYTKQLGKASKIQKSCLQNIIDVFTEYVGFKFSCKKEELALQLGLSRPTLNKRIKEAIIKSQKLTTEYCYSNMDLGELVSLGI